MKIPLWFVNRLKDRPRLRMALHDIHRRIVDRHILQHDVNALANYIGWHGNSNLGDDALYDERPLRDTAAERRLHGDSFAETRRRPYRPSFFEVE